MTADTRVAWVDYAKGFCIVMVVMMHSTLGVQEDAGATTWMGEIVAFARPFRMPDFFLIAGLFLGRVIDRDWRTYLDAKVVHFVYFYVLWVSIQFAFRAPGYVAEFGPAGAAEMYLLAFVEPFGTLWFIYILPIFFVVTKLLGRVPALAVFLVAAALEIAPIHTGWMLVDEFAARYVYFYAGYKLAAHVFALARRVDAHRGAALTGLAAWALLNGALVFAGLAEMPFFGLALGAVGACAVVAGSALLASRGWAAPLRYLGKHSLVVYLAFFLPMVVTRLMLLKTGIVPDLGTVALLVTIAAVIGPIVAFWIVRATPLRFLFERPGWARLSRPAPRMVAAE